MSKLSYKTLLVSLLILLSLSADAAVRLPRLVSDGMILQRDTPLKIWGWADQGEAVTVTFADKIYRTTADDKGEWSITLEERSAGGPYSMQINDIEVKDILIGDIWLCAGQSNMELPIRRTLDLYEGEIRATNNPRIREFKVPLKYNFQKRDVDLEGGKWLSATPENLLDFSAVAYFFAKELYDKYQIPVGIINASVGGSPAEAWMSVEALADYPHYIKEAETCADTAHIDSIRQADKQRNDSWYATLNQNDAGIGKWNRENFDDKNWSSISLPGYWADKGAGAINGSLWFRKDFTIDASIAGKEAILRLGSIVDADSVFINGRFIGTTSYRYPPRIYPIPAGILQKGRNNITVRVISNSGAGGFVEEKPYKIVIGDNEIDLTGDWKYSAGAKMSPLASQTFFQYKPTGLFNAMIAPLKNYKIRGVVWYQGESNIARAPEYKGLMGDLIGSWRTMWRTPYMPFIYAQLPNFGKVRTEPSESGWALMREAQRRMLDIPCTRMAVTIDLGEWNDIHPLNKKSVGERLALEAESLSYGANDVISSPKYEKMQQVENTIILTFSSVGSGIYTNLNLEGFTIAGADGKYLHANAAPIANNKVRVWNNMISDPVSVRYAWEDNPAGANLRSREGFAASPFTTEQLWRDEKTFTKNKIGAHDGFDYELWHDTGDVSMTLKEGGTFECSWDNIHNVLFRTGKKLDCTKTFDQLGDISITYGCDYNPIGNSYLCVYGWSVKPLVEFYIVEAWGNWRPPGAKPIASVVIDGGKYDIYKTVRVEKPSIEGETTFEQFWSVRTKKKTSGTISVGEHFKAWEKAGLKLGKLYEISFCIEGYESRGTADMYEYKLQITNP